MPNKRGPIMKLYLIGVLSVFLVLGACSPGTLDSNSDAGGEEENTTDDATGTEDSGSYDTGTDDSGSGPQSRDRDPQSL